MLNFVRRFPLVMYFAVAYALSGVALVVLGLPHLEPGGTPQGSSLVVFPVMVIGVGVSGVILTALTQGGRGLRNLGSRMTRWRLNAGWYAVLLIPPAGILVVLGLLHLLVSPDFAPNFLSFGVLAGLVAGFFEEIGWTGFAFTRLRSRFGALKAALGLGVLWGLWHLPVVDSLGAASPHGQYWPAFFGSFLALVVAIRVLIAWVYSNTGSVLLAQLLHASSTGFLVILSAPRVSPSQEAFWYAMYAALLWLVVALVTATFGPNLARASAREEETPWRDRWPTELRESLGALAPKTQ